MNYSLFKSATTSEDTFIYQAFDTMCEVIGRLTSEFVCSSLKISGIAPIHQSLTQVPMDHRKPSTIMCSGTSRSSRFISQLGRAEHRGPKTRCGFELPKHLLGL